MIRPLDFFVQEVSSHKLLTMLDYGLEVNSFSLIFSLLA